MPPPAESRPQPLSRRTALAAVAILAVGLAGCVTPARGARHAGARGHAHHGGGAGQAAEPIPEAPASSEGQLLSPGKASSGEVAREIGASGQVDPIAGLGIRNPVCDELGQIRSQETRVSCESSGMPDSNYPTTNYGFDVFIPTGVTHPIGDLTYGFVMILNGIWLGLTFVLKLVFELLGLAFGLNPFSDGQTMRRIAGALARIYGSITDPWLSALVVAGGIWFAYKGLVRREVAAGVGGTLAAIAMLVVGLWVVHQPSASVGRLAGLADEVAVTAISAPQSGSLARPIGSFAEAMSRTWSRLVEVPFAGLDFSDVRWALGKPPPEAVKIADQKFCDDVGALATLATLAHLGSGEAQQACAEFAHKRYGRPRRLIDLYLRSSPGSPAREALWDYFNGEDRYKAKVAAQGGDGALTRLSMLALFAIGLLGAILLLLWLAIRLFTQAAIAFVLLLAAPFALFFPMLGEGGRRAFKRWGMTLVGATIAKVIYGALLSVVLVGMAILGAIGGATGFLLTCAFAWSLLLKRSELVGWMSAGDVQSRRSIGRLKQLGGFAVADRMAREMGGAIRDAGRRGDRARNRLSQREAARRPLQHGARGVAEPRAGEPQQKEPPAERDAGRRSSTEKAPAAAAAASSARAKAPPSDRQAGPRSDAADHGGGERKPPRDDASRNGRPAEPPPHGEKKGKKAGAETRDWRQLQMRLGEEEKQASRPGEPADGPRRSPYSRPQLEELRRSVRQEAIEKIERESVRGAGQPDISPEPPGRVVGRPRAGRERPRYVGALSSVDRWTALQRLRRERREPPHADRRDLSRGV